MIERQVMRPVSARMTDNSLQLTAEKEKKTEIGLLTRRHIGLPNICLLYTSFFCLFICQNFCNQWALQHERVQMTDVTRPQSGVQTP